MPTPFPGMDPYLEHPDLWLDVHNSLVAAIRDFLVPLLRPRYLVRIEERAYMAEAEDLVLVGSPDVSVVSRRDPAEAPKPSKARRSSAQVLPVRVPVPETVRETYLEVRATLDRGDVVTVIELLSPTNKRPGKGRRLYLAKRRSVLATLTSLVEIDLVRAGRPMPLADEAPPADYRILLSRGDCRPRAELLLFSVRDAVPCFRVPLRRGDEEPEVDTGGLLHDLYDRAGYDLSIDYAGEPVPRLTPSDRAWADDLLRREGLRK